MRNSIDDNGMEMNSSVHFGVDFDNAVWTGNQMVYGDGSDLLFKKGSVASNLSVTAHELTHGVTDHEANLVYRGQPGALNEHMSDVFAIMCDQWVNKHTVDESSWLIGKDMLIEGQALRSLKQPGTAYPSDKQIGHMQASTMFSPSNSGTEWTIGNNNVKIDQINISHNDYNNTLRQLKNEKNDIQGGNFSFTPSQKEIFPLSSEKLNEVKQHLNFILSHFDEPIFPRNIMTNALGYQKEAFK
jgi:hypothetical protein